MRRNNSKRILMSMNVYSIISLILISIVAVQVQGSVEPGTQESSRVLYQDAIKLMFQNKYTEAIAKFDSLLINFPQSFRVADSAYNIGFCYERLGNRKEAFNRYKNVISTYSGTIAARRAMPRAIGLARSLRHTAGDEYDNFLKGSIYFGSASARLSAMRMAELGNWQRIDLIIEAMEQGSLFEQMRASDLLRFKVNEVQVQNAFKKVLEGSKHPYVKMNALMALSRIRGDESVKNIFISMMLKEPDVNLRSNAARSLSVNIEEKSVKEAFSTVIQQEEDPLVLQVVSNIVLSDDKKEYFAPFVVKRLENEDDPMVKMVLSTSLQITKYQSPKVEVVVRSMTDNPKPEIRINALKILKPKSSDPEIQYIFIDTLKNDPNESVRIVAVNGLKDQAEDDKVREVLIEIINTTEDVSLATTSIKAVGTFVQVPKVRKDLVFTLKRAEAPIVANQIVHVLAPELRNPEVKGVIFDILRQPGKNEVKYAVAEALNEADFHVEYLSREFQDLFLHEENEQLSNFYLAFIRRADPVVAKELKTRKLHWVEEKKREKK